jgi:hypothetical protein
VTSYYDQYGPIGIVFALVTYFITIGVVLILGPVVSIVWQERQLSFARALALRCVLSGPSLRAAANGQPASRFPPRSSTTQGEELDPASLT